MRCANCGAALPDGALFCGECGRTVGGQTGVADSTTLRRRRSDPPVAPSLVPPPAPPTATPTVEPIASAPVGLPAPSGPAHDREIARDREHVSDPDGVQDSDGEQDLGTDSARRRTRDDERASGGAPVPGSAAASDPSMRCDECGADLDPGDIFCAECGAVVRHATGSFGRRGVADGAPRPSSPAPRPPSTGTPGAAPPTAGHPLGGLPWADEPPEPELPPDLERTRIVAPRSDERFTLQFSTGESVTVTGSGLIGRNPVPEPGELIDRLVRVLDPTRSVSKTHLAFGQESGALWISDRYSGNGTVVRDPGVDARRCEPGRRYRVARGARVDIGEQFFVVA